MPASPDTDSAIPSIAIIGAGPAGLVAALVLAEAGCAVDVYDRMASPARKFLLAGRGGLNLTHSEPRAAFLARYREAAGWLAPMLDAYPPSRLCALAAELGEPTFVGSSGRVFPKGFKASPMLRAWLARLAALGVRFHGRHDWRGWAADGALQFATVAGQVERRPDATLLALGGASWPRLGSDGGWVDALRAAGVPVAALRPANCGVTIGWSDIFRTRFAGEPVKPVVLEHGGERVRGEVMVTERGLEGGAIYALSAPLREAVVREGRAELTLDLRPDLAEEALAARLAKPRGKGSLANHLRKAGGLSPVAISLLREGETPLPHEAPALAARIKRLRLRVTAMAPIERAISTAGGVTREAVGNDLMLRARPEVFVAGEMLDWEAPTGGYLLQACLASGHAAALGILERTGRPLPPPWTGGW
ncbi:TIGR03862 family flavoprotein [Ancylobacter terrae]|uniref:TIGR03862 family flavoprotein n=1 Tax=Ancylobacter sp. sgz301288 TaxID=3342077 RepID=UPI00385A7804